MIKIKIKMNKLLSLILVLFLSLVLVACSEDPIKELSKENYNNDVYYQIFVRSFADSDGDGIGDFNGITEKLAYLNDLGITGIWLMPIFPSPSYHGYDVIDYKAINSEYGTIEDFERLMKEAEKKGIKVIIDMIFNHSSSEHPWFKAALEGDEKYRNYYVFSNSSTNTSTIENDKNVWHKRQDKQYYGYFSDSMPDLNLDNEQVLNEFFEIGKFWIDLGVDGFRLDAVQHFFWTNEYQEQRYTAFKNISFTKILKTQLKEYNPKFYMTGEIYNTAESIVAEYFNAVDSPLDFPISHQIYKTLTSNSDPYYVSKLNNIYKTYNQVYKHFVSAPFLKNHDEDRLASLLDNDLTKLKLAAEMLLTLPGSPIIYYGEEVGMLGVKSAGGISKGIGIWDETRRLPFPFGDKYRTTWFNDESFNGVKENKSIDIEKQMSDSNSLWSTYQKLLKLRNENIALKYGNSFVGYENNSNYLQGFYREIDERGHHQKLLILHNLSKDGIMIDEVKGKLIYGSYESSLSYIAGKSTIIIDVSDVENA
jgi:glycosidase